MSRRRKVLKKELVPVFEPSVPRLVTQATGVLPTGVKTLPHLTTITLLPHKKTPLPSSVTVFFASLNRVRRSLSR
jgi:hypothetical protein